VIRTITAPGKTTSALSGRKARDVITLLELKRSAAPIRREASR